ncbi:hypothetical protein [Micromonospora sp. NBC_01813]|uniref:hypothetical protein n=1 Tax=Micromonospora sp. NBC_01813 TaxID=2975988 RepID=UPI002DD86519|nr:hypothetical protein [Micromonospora sp. NBC_01813]WSA09164.1 hypothetical protein OG958_34315 [Micromonospora sp. NBC_01813]
MSEDPIVDALTVLTAGPTPYGQERATAERLANWGRAHWPLLDWRVEPLPSNAATPRSANLVATSHLGDGPELLIYSHLDTSLTGAAEFDEPITGPPTGVATPTRSCGLRRSAAPDGTALISGFGLGVARAAAASALAGFTTAAAALQAAGRPHQLTLLLAAAGTHRQHPGGQTPGGVAHHLDRYPPPAAAVVAKTGPAGVLTAEPGAMFLRVRLTTRLHPVLARESAVPPGGLIVHLGTVIEALEEFRRRHLAQRADPAAQVGAEIGIGAVRSGQPGKPDLLAGLLELHLYLVMVPGDDPVRIRDDLHTALERAFADTPLRDCPVSVDAQLVHPAAATDPAAPIARHAYAAWAAAHGEPPRPVTGWTGSTDGVVLRGRGVPTVRLGPPSRGPDPTDPRLDRYAVTDVARFASIYADIAARHAGASTT